MFISLLFRACFLELFLLFFDCFPNCAKPKNIENSLVLIQYFALGTFRKRTKKIKKQCKNSSSFGIDFSSKIMTFSGSKSAWIFGWFFHWKWPPKVGHFQWKNHPKNKTFSEPLKNRFFLRSWSAPGQCPMTVLIFVFRFFFIFWSKMATKMVWNFAAFWHPERSQNALISHLRRNLDFS